MTPATRVEANRRGSEREAVALAGSALAPARSRSVIISDLSPEGAQIDGRDLPGAGEELIVVAGPLDTMATVVWRTDTKCGIRFDDVVSEATIARMKDEAKWTSVLGWCR